ncbi:MAG TPA: MIP/aquaporin family protein [Kofleriaceae bacterium]|nr:MIP/aquaporin family protein [Kofleriaceae bacterium]
MSLGRRVAAEALGTALLVAAVIGSGIMGQRLAGPDVALALLANTIATGGALVALILTFGPLSGAHFNPIVTAWAAASRALSGRDAAAYVAAQVAGAIAGAVLANAMFDLPAVTWATTARGTTALLVSEAVATFGLLGVIISTSRRHPAMTPFAVAAYIVAAYWFTASTSFANPAVTIGRAVSDTFAGIRPLDVPAFIAAQLVGGALAGVCFRWLVPARDPDPLRAAD